MDIRMPVVSGITATRRILAEAVGQPPRILVLTTFDLDDYVYDALRAGASGFLLKESEPARLLAAIHTVAVGDKLFSPTVTQRLIETYLHHHDRPGAPAGLDVLTSREREVLRLVGTVHQRRHGQDPPQPDHGEARSGQSRAGGGAGLRDRAGEPFAAPLSRFRIVGSFRPCGRGKPVEILEGEMHGAQPGNSGGGGRPTYGGFRGKPGR